jgi:hypothetical protein
MLKDTRYGPMSFELVNILSERLEDLPYPNKEIAEHFGLAVNSPELKKVIRDAITMLTDKQIPVIRLAKRHHLCPGGGLVRIAPDAKMQSAYEKQQKGMMRLHNTGMADIKSVNVSQLNPEMQNAAIAVNTTAKLLQTLATDESREKLLAHIRTGGANLLDTKKVFAELLSHNL